VTEWLASLDGPTSVQDLLLEALEYGYRFGDWHRGIRHGDWWAWFGTDAGIDEASLRILSESDRERWLHFDAKGRAQFILRLLRDCLDPMPDFVLDHHYLEHGMTYRSVTYLLAREVFDAVPRTNFNSMEMVDESAEATMDDGYLDTVVDYLFMRGVELGPGLKDNEVDAIERRCTFRFPPDLRMFLQRVHPLGRTTPPPNAIVVGGPFPDWRNAPDDYIQLRFKGILHGICFDIEHGFWNPAWGTRPPDIAMHVMSRGRNWRRRRRSSPSLVIGSCRMSR